MNRNGKIALGCGAAGCLGLIVVVIACVVLVVTGVVPAPGLYDANRNSNYNSNDDSNTNSNSNTNTNDNANKNSDSSSSSSSMSDDDKHKLFQAVGITKDRPLIERVLRKLGFLTATGAISSDYEQFVKDHANWALNNLDFVRSVLTEDKARAYVEEHIDD
jgi:predicted metalloprotease